MKRRELLKSLGATPLIAITPSTSPKKGKYKIEVSDKLEEGRRHTFYVDEGFKSYNEANEYTNRILAIEKKAKERIGRESPRTYKIVFVEEI